MNVPALAAALVFLVLSGTGPAQGQLFDKQRLLERQTFWDNRDWDWYQAYLPFFESPDPEIDTTYYYRWELVTKHLTYGSPDTGYLFTEFIDRPFWSGAYGAISCPAGHQLYEVRWLRDPRFARDYARYWFRTPGAEPRRYSTWLADAVWALERVHPDSSFTTGLLSDLVKNFEGWERARFVPEVGLFWQTGHDDGMETNINSRQTRDTLRGAPGYRPTLNSYLWADARAISRIALLAGDPKLAETYAGKAAAIKRSLEEKLWDPNRRFFFHMFKDEEELDGQRVEPLTLTYQSGRFAGSPHGRELIGYVPWAFGLPDPGREAAWRFLMDRDYFLADFGPTVTERRDPLFAISNRCCVWSGQSWPYATTQTLVAMANLLQDYRQEIVKKSDYWKLLRIYALTHRKEGRPYLAEAAHPDTGSFEGHDSFNHSEHYFHSGFVDLIITGLVGLRPRDDDLLEVNPLAPEEWDYFALADVGYRGRLLAVVWDRRGDRYGLGPGLHLLAGGKPLASSPALGRLTVPLPPAPAAPSGTGLSGRRPVNFAANNDGRYYPRAIGSFSTPGAPLPNIQDGSYWYHASPPNRWTCEGSTGAKDWCGIDFGIVRRIHTVKLYLLDDGGKVAPPARIDLERWDRGAWVAVEGQERRPASPAGRRANLIRFPEIETERLRTVFTHAEGATTGLTELEAWGEGEPPLAEPPPPAGNLALNVKGEGYPRASASYTSRFDRVETVNDGLTIYRPTTPNRWTAFGSPESEDWLEIDFGEPKEVGRLELYIYDDGGGVRPPLRYDVRYRDGEEWKQAAAQKKSPPEPAGRAQNTVLFERVLAREIRVVFTHRDKARSGLTEIEAWRE